jgi:hypothetical protein
MIPLILPGFSRAIPYIVVAVLSLGCIFYAYSRGHSAGEAKVQAKFDTYKSAQAKAVEKQIADNARLQNEGDLLRYRIERDLAPKLAAAGADNKRLAGLLREHYARNSSSPLPQDPVASADSPGDVRDRSLAAEIDATFGEIAKSCRRDGARQNGGWLPWWEGIPCELKESGC